MRVTLVGPELSPKSIFSKNLTLADNMTASLHSEDYDSFRRKRSLLKSYREPDLLVAFNPGFGTDRADWLPTLEGLLREKASCFKLRAFNLRAFNLRAFNLSPCSVHLLQSWRVLSHAQDHRLCGGKC